jgi:hypothetical protein
VHSGQEPLNHALGDDLDPAEAGDFGRIEQV